MTGVLERTFAFIAQSSDNFLCLCTFLIIFNGVVVMPMCLSRSFVFPFVDLFLPSPYARIHGIICLAHYADTLKFLLNFSLGQLAQQRTQISFLGLGERGGGG